MYISICNHAFPFLKQKMVGPHNGVVSGGRVKEPQILLYHSQLTKLWQTYVKSCDFSIIL